MIFKGVSPCSLMYFKTSDLIRPHRPVGLSLVGSIPYFAHKFITAGPVLGIGVTCESETSSSCLASPGKFREILTSFQKLISRKKLLLFTPAGAVIVSTTVSESCDSIAGI